MTDLCGFPGRAAFLGKHKKRHNTLIFNLFLKSKGGLMERDGN